MPNVSKLLRVLKNNLPIEVKSKKNQSFTFRDWGIDEETHIAELKEEVEGVGQFVSIIVRYMLKTLHGEDFEAKPENEKIVTINQMDLANVLYIYLYLRFDQLDEKLGLNFKCPTCSNKVENFIADLGDLDIECKEGNYDEIISYKLQKPITLDTGDVLIEELIIGIAKWDVMEKANEDATRNTGAAKKKTLEKSIVGTNVKDLTFNPLDIVKKLRKIDIEYINKEIDIHNGGPNIVAEVKCNKCRDTFQQRIDWSYDYFFGTASLPPR